VQPRQLEPVALEDVARPFDRLGCGHVVVVVAEELDLARRVRRVREHAGQAEPPAPHHDDVVGAVVVALGLGQLEHAADAEERLSTMGLVAAGGAERLGDLEALADRDGAEDPLRRVGFVEQFLDERAVALLEDVEGQRHPGEDNGVQREQRQRPGHVQHPRLVP
jgi:hypothetical protein